MSPGQADVSKDFLTGSRAAWQEINAKGINGLIATLSERNKINAKKS